MSLGYDVDGNEYTYFPQFCGDDVRIYRHRRYGENPSFDPPDALTVLGKQKELLRIHGKAASPVPDSNVTTGSLVSDSDVALKNTEIENNKPKDTKISGVNISEQDAREESVVASQSSPELLDKLDQDQIATESASGKKMDFEVTTESGEKMDFEMKTESGEKIDFEMTTESGEKMDFEMKTESGEKMDFEMKTESGEKMGFEMKTDDENGFTTTTNDGSAKANTAYPVQNNTIAANAATKIDNEKWSDTLDATLLAQSRKIIENAISKHSKSFTAASKASEDVENSYDSSDAQWAPKTAKKRSKKTK